MLTKEDKQWIEEKLDERLGPVEGQIDCMNGRLDSMDERMDRMDKRFDSMDERMDHMDKRFDSLEDDVRSLKLSIENQIEPLVREAVSILKSPVRSTHEELDFRVNTLEVTTKDIEVIASDHEKRLQTLEEIV